MNDAPVAVTYLRRCWRLLQPFYRHKPGHASSPGLWTTRSLRIRLIFRARALEGGKREAGSVNADNLGEFVQRHFMEYLSKEYRQAVVQLIGAGVIDWDDVKGTGRLNDDATLFLKEAPPAIRMDQMVPRLAMVKKPKMRESVRQVS